MRLNVITCVFNRHDLLTRLAQSLENSSQKPDILWVVDHAYDKEKALDAVAPFTGDTKLLQFKDPGAAYYYNWAMRKLIGDKVFCNDDISFYPEALERLVNTPGGFLSPQNTGPKMAPFSCFKLSDELYAKIGPVDESISPGYLYFEDCDYHYRIKLAGEPEIIAHDSVVEHAHGGSASLKAYTKTQLAEHHRKFLRAKQNYVAKWGGEPNEERFTTPYNR